MRKKGKFTIINIDYHRNGISGIGFHVVLFKDTDSDIQGHTMLGIVFPEGGACAVLDTQLLAEGDIKFASNSWRGDYFEGDLREAILKFTNDERAKYGLPPLTKLD